MIRTILALATLLVTCTAGAHFPIAKRLHQIDTNQDRALSIAEVLTARQARFFALDTDHNQALTPTEISNKVSSRMTNGVRADVKQDALNRIGKRFYRLDKNHDGRITQAEWDSKVAELFARFDVNNDHQITQLEVRTIRQSKRAQR